MKKQISALFAVLAVASMASAQTLKTEAPQSSYRLDASRGFRVALIKPILETSGSGDSTKVKAPDAIGLSAGYASLPIQSLGWTVDGSYMRFQNTGNVEISIWRIAGNMGYAFNSLAFAKGGLNLSNLNLAGFSLTPSIGFQGGFGLQATQNFGIDISYVSMSQSFLGLGTVTESGPEIGLHATF